MGACTFTDQSVNTSGVTAPVSSDSSSTSDPAPPSSTTTNSTATSPPTTSPTASTRPKDLVPTAVPAADADAVIDLFDELNAKAAGRIAEQQRVFVSRMANGLADDQQDCGQATVTIRFRPVWQELQADPEFDPPEPQTDATPYRVPALVEIFSGERRVGTDLTLVHLQVQDGLAQTFPMCLS